MHALDEPFLREIASRPDDDMPRLVYADWLEEQGDPRSEFIRLQCERETLPWHVPRYWELLDREETLLAKHGLAWVNAAPKFRNVRWGIETRFSAQVHIGEPIELFRRGFPEVATVRNLQALINIGAVPTAALVREIMLLDFGPRLMGRLISSGWIRRLRGIALPGKALGRDFLEPLGGSPDAVHLHRLDLESNFIQRSGLEALCSSPYLTALRTLNLADNRLQGRDLSLLADWRGMSSVHSLIFFGNALGDEAAPFLRSAKMSSLHVLNIGYCNGGSRLVDALADNEHLERMTHLSLLGNRVDAASLRRFFQRNACPNLRLLNLHGCRVQDETLETLAHSPMSSNLRNLILGGRSPAITRRGIQGLAEATRLGCLRQLTLIGMTVDADIAQAFASSSALSRLRKLTVDEPFVSPEARACLQKRFDLDFRSWSHPTHF